MQKHQLKVNKLKQELRVIQLREFIVAEVAVEKEEVVEEENTEVVVVVEEEIEVAEAGVVSSETAMKMMMVSPLLRMEMMKEAEVAVAVEVSSEEEETEVSSEVEVNTEVEVKLVQEEEVKEPRELIEEEKTERLQLKLKHQLRPKSEHEKTLIEES
jgi:hypothetical protein